MPRDIMGYFDSPYLSAFDLVDKSGNPKDYTLTVERVVGGEVTMAGGKTNRKPIIHFRGAKKPMVCNKTNARIAITMYGRDPEKWVGRMLTIYAGTTQKGPGIMVRPMIPKLGSPTGVPPERAANAEDSAELARKTAAFAGDES